MIELSTRGFYIFGTGGFARESYFIFKRKYFDIISFVDINHVGKKLFGIDIISFSDYNPKYRSFVATGDPILRLKICDEITKLGGLFMTIIDPSVIITDPASVHIQEGSIICPGSILTTNIKIGKNCHINLSCTIGHDTILKDYVTLAPGVNISGNVNIGSKCYIGTNASIIEKINICDNVTIGMGSVVIKNIDEPGTYVGIPARRIK